MAVKILIEHSGVSYSAEVMRIRRTSLGIEDHGIWTGYLHCEGDGTGTGVGGYVLDSKPDSDFGGRRVGTAYGMDWIKQVCEVVGVEKWEDLSGKAIYVLYPEEGHWGQIAKGISNIDTGKCLLFEEHAQMWRDHEGMQ